jgi:hypothetical protein
MPRQGDGGRKPCEHGTVIAALPESLTDEGEHASERDRTSSRVGDPANESLQDQEE